MLESIAKVVTDAVRSILFMIDQIVYGLIPTLYKLIISLANVDLYNGNPVVSALLNRVYVIVGIFMLFKLAFSILRYIIDPNSFSDQSKGFTGLVKRVLIALILLVSTPWIFNKIYEYQGIILDKNIIPNLILGTNESGVSDIEVSAKDLQFMMFGPFFSLNTETADLSVCAPDSDYPLANIVGSTDMALKDDGKCIQTFSDLTFKDSTVKASGTTVGTLFKTSDTEDGREFGRLGSLLTWTVDDGVYAINYTPIISTICGGYLVFLLLSFCIDVAVRAIKLLFLQILSPIAIISSVDPTSSSQNDKLKDWGMECLKTFLSLFLRLAVIYIVIQMVKIITSKLFSSPAGIYYAEFAKNNLDTIAHLNVFVYIFLILGAFSVAKKVPELIEKAFGVKFSGEISMNPFKTFTGNAGFGLMAGATTGAIAGGLSGGVSAFSTSMNHEKGLGRSLLSGVGGALSGGTTGTFRGGRARGGKGWGAGMQSGGRIARRMEVREATGGIKGVPGMTMDRLRDKMGAPTTYEGMESKASRYDDVSKKIKEMNDRAVDQLSKKSDAWKLIQANRAKNEQEFKEGRITDGSGRILSGKDAETAYKNRLNSYYTEEQRLISKYVDTGGEDLGGGKFASAKDEQLDYRKQAVKKAIGDTRDPKIMYQLDDDGEIKKDKSGKPIKKIDIDSASWSEIGGDGALLKTNAERMALGVRSNPSYNDAFDRHQAIHGARVDSHMKH